MYEYLVYCTLLAYTKPSKKKYIQFMYSKLGLFLLGQIYYYDTDEREGENNV